MNSIEVSASLHSVRTNLFPRQNTAAVGDAVSELLNRIEQRREVRTATRLRDDLVALKKELELAANSTSPTATTITTTIEVNPVARSSTAVGLNLNEGYTTLTSGGPINGDTTTYAPTQPLWNGTSSASPTFTGTYNGDQGTGTINFEVKRAGINGSERAQIDVRDQFGTKFDRIDLEAGNPVDQLYTLTNGLVVQFSAGSLVKDDTFDVQVAEAADLQPDLNAAFDGSLGSYPLFEAGREVVAGSFTVNGINITVAADDSISSVLANITASAADVMATYNSTTEQIGLERKTAGSQLDITLADDTSGFLAAVKLQDQSAVLGTPSELDQTMGAVGALSGIAAGSVLINGTSVAVDPAVDSLQDLIDRINTDVDSVGARYTTSGELELASSLAEPLVLDSNGTGFFEALNIASGTYNPTLTEVQSPGPVAANARTGAQLNSIVQRMTRITEQISDLFKDPFANTEPVNAFLAEIESLLAGDRGESLQSAGLQKRSRFVSLERGYRTEIGVAPQQLFRSLYQDYDSVYATLLSPNAISEGALNQFLDAVDATILRPREAGTLLNVYV